jgi:nucleoside 2-deoxyribosyltransferase
MAQKPTHRKLRCFVASAFGFDDVDRVYTKLIKPTLGPLHIAVSRVDRVDHNDDIDNKIMELLDEADFCIADLTYARPSVYYEAGYAMARKPVIFISRKDHFRARDDDPAGNLRVHFDLQMKNIIPWGNSDAVFNSSLRKRVMLVANPIVKKLQSHEAHDKESAAFSSLSPNLRIESLEQIAKKEALARSFVITSGEHQRWLQMFGLGSAIDAHKNFRDTDVTVRFYIEPQFQLKGLRDVGYRDALKPRKQSELINAPNRRQIVVSVLATMAKITQSTVERAFPHHAKIAGLPFLESLRSSVESRGVVRSLVVPIAQISSLKEFRTRIIEVFDFACSAKIRNF